MTTTVEKLMCRRVQACSSDQTLADAARMMWENDCGCVPIVEEGGRVAVMITDRDVCMAAYLNGRPLDEIRIRDVMSKDVASCSPQDRVTDAVGIMRRAQVRRLPVVDRAGQLVGILSLHDVARAAERDLGARSPEIGLDDLALTLCAVSSPRQKGAFA